MFLTSNEEKKFFYRISDIKIGTTSKGSPYAFISISNKKQRDNEYENGKLMFWDKVENVEKGDLVAFYNVLGTEQYSFQATGSLKTYTGVNISTSKIEIKKAQKTESKPEQTTETTQPSSEQKEELQPIDDDNLPF